MQPAHRSPQRSSLTCVRARLHIAAVCSAPNWHNDALLPRHSSSCALLVAEPRCLLAADRDDVAANAPAWSLVASRLAVGMMGLTRLNTVLRPCPSGHAGMTVTFPPDLVSLHRSKRVTRLPVPALGTRLCDAACHVIPFQPVRNPTERPSLICAHKLYGSFASPAAAGAAVTVLVADLSKRTRPVPTVRWRPWQCRRAWEWRRGPSTMPTGA